MNKLELDAWLLSFISSKEISPEDINKSKEYQQILRKQRWEINGKQYTFTLPSPESISDIEFIEKSKKLFSDEKLEETEQPKPPIKPSRPKPHLPPEEVQPKNPIPTKPKDKKPPQ